MLIALLIAFAITVYFKPKVAVGLILALLPTYLIRFSYHNIPTTFLELLLLIFVTITFVKNFRQFPELKNTGAANWVIVLFVIAGAIGIWVSPDHHAAIGIFKAFILEPVLFFYAVRLTLKTASDIIIPLNMLFLSAVVISFLGIGQYVTFIHLPLRFWGTGAEVERIASVFEYPNALALYLAPLVSFFLAALLFEEKRILDRKNTIVGLVIILIALFLTFSRGGWLAAIFTGLVMVGYKYGWKKVLGASLVLAALILIIPATRNRLMLSFHDPSSEARNELMVAAWQKIQHSPIVGNGLGGFPTTLAQSGYSGDTVNYPHNIFFNFWTEMGVLGLLSFFAVMFFSASRIKKNMQWYTIGAVAFLLTLVVHGLVDVPYFKNDLSVLFWFIISIFYIQ